MMDPVYKEFFLEVGAQDIPEDLVMPTSNDIDGTLSVLLDDDDEESEYESDV